MHSFDKTFIGAIGGMYLANYAANIALQFSEIKEAREFPISHEVDNKVQEYAKRMGIPKPLKVYEAELESDYTGAITGELTLQNKIMPLALAKQVYYQKYSFIKQFFQSVPLSVTWSIMGFAAMASELTRKKLLIGYFASFNCAAFFAKYEFERRATKESAKVLADDELREAILESKPLLRVQIPDFSLPDPFYEFVGGDEAILIQSSYNERKSSIPFKFRRKDS